MKNITLLQCKRLYSFETSLYSFILKMHLSNSGLIQVTLDRVRRVLQKLLRLRQR